MRRSGRVAVLFVVLVVLAVSALAQSGGDALFVARCASCHGKDGLGKTQFAQKATMPDLRSQQIQSQTDRQLYDSIGHGVGHKQYPHAFLMRGMSESELLAVVKFIRSLNR